MSETKALKTYDIMETCTYQIEAESQEAAKALWLNGGPTENVWELMQKNFTGVTERSIECITPDEDGCLDGDVEVFNQGRRPPCSNARNANATTS